MTMRVSRTPSPFLLATTLAVAVFMLAPMALSVVAGLVNNYSRGIASGFTLRWLAEVLDGYGGTIGWSLALAVGTVAATLLLGVPCAYALARSRSRWAGVFEELLTLPVAVPGLATALALILAYGQIAVFRQSFAFILVGHIVFTLPFMVRVVGSAFQRRELRALPAIAAGCLMVFTLSVGEFNLTWMLHTPLTRTLPVGLADSYASARIEIGSAYTLVFFIVILPVLWALQHLANLLQRRYGN